MDAAALDRARHDLVAWNVVEPGDAPRLTRRFTGALLRAFAVLQEEERAGARRPGEPIALAIDVAFVGFPLPPGVQLSPTHRRVAAGVYLASLPDAVRDAAGV